MKETLEEVIKLSFIDLKLESNPLEFTLAIHGVDIHINQFYNGYFIANSVSENNFNS